MKTVLIKIDESNDIFGDINIKLNEDFYERFHSSLLNSNRKNLAGCIKDIFGDIIYTNIYSAISRDPAVNESIKQILINILKDEDGCIKNNILEEMEYYKERIKLCEGILKEIEEK